MEHPDRSPDVSGYIAGLILGAEDPVGQGSPLHSMSIRIPLELAAYVIEMATSTGKSRNEMARLLLQAGVDEVLGRLPAEASEDIRLAVGERFGDMRDDHFPD